MIFPIPCFPQHRGRNDVLLILGLLGNWFQLQLLYLFFVVKQHLQAVVVISVSRGKELYL